ncbi:serine-rich adhesin for platelets isoform X4 [Cryptotermes secundus]|uniref:serine-rich adhesin for platelets isoform X4 n=1 Tax=Cryptotermes secundus TaxID=105785 RepID=UPI000CD7C2D3|nr:serine-rich adhesin for platelets isoform X4 [Cryptotermes secundus]
MAPWPEQGNEPKAPDKSCSKGGDSSLSDSAKVISGTTEDVEATDTANKTDYKQPEDKNPDVSNLDDGQLKALLDEAITYKRPKDREGKSDLFRELLQEAEADETECGDRHRVGADAIPEQVVSASGSRCYSNSNKRRGRRDTAVSEHQTHGGSLQNLVYDINSEFDTSGFGYFSQSSGHSGGVGRRKSKRGNSGRDYCVSVSARQREGGSLPSNVNVGGASGGMLTLSGLEFPPTAPLSSAATAALLFDDARGYISKQNKPRKELGHTVSANEFTTAMPVHSSANVSYQTGGEAPNNVSKTEFMVVDLRDLGKNGQETKTSGVVVGESAVEGGSGTGSLSGGEGGKVLGGDLCNSGMDEEVGIEMEVIQRSEATRVPNYTSRATLEVGLGGDCSTKNKNLTDGGDVDTTVAFPLGIIQCEKRSGVVNGVEQSTLQLPSSYNSVKCIVGSTSNSNREDRNSGATKGDDDKQVENKKHHGRRQQLDGGSSLIETRDTPMYGSIPLTHGRNFFGFTFMDLSETVSRLTFHGSKDTSGDGKNKSYDENGNAVQQNYRLESTNSNDRKSKQRRMKTNNDRNVIMSQNIEGYRGDKDIESLIEFIESNKESKGKTKNNSAHSNGTVGFGNKQQRNNVRREEVVTGTKARRERAIEDGQDEEKASGKNRIGGKQSSKDHRGSDKVGGDVGSSGQMKKSNSLEEISKTKLEDLTAEQVGTSSASDSLTFSAQVTLRRPKKQATLDDDELYGEKGETPDHTLWGTEDIPQYFSNDGSATASADESGPVAASGRKRRGIVDEKRKPEDGVPAVVVSAAASEETEFHVVTKKQRRKKKRSSSGSRAGSSAGGHGGLFGDENRRPAVSQYGHSYYQNRGDSQRKGFVPGSGFPPHDRTVEREGGSVMLYQYNRSRSPEHLRRKSTSSMPPSDKSDSSDLDSVHSLPVSSTTPKLALDQTSTSSGSTPQASYADITRMASSNVNSPSSTQGSCNIGAGKWPTMTTTKSQAVSPPATSTCTSTTTTTTTTTTISSTVISSANITVSSACINTSTTSVPAVATPLALNNPQFITGPKLNIGVPPVSGSKATVSTSANPSNNVTCTSSSNSVPQSNSLTSVTSSDAASSSSTVALNQNPESSCNPAVSSRHRNNPPLPDPRTKKDAMTSTTLDYKLIPVEEYNPSHRLQAAVNKPTEHLPPSPNVIMDSYYPSLEESLVADKVDRKPGRCSNPCSTSSRLPAEETPSTTVAPFNVSASEPENCGKGPRHVDICSEIRVKQQPLEASVIAPRSSLCSAGEPVAPEVSVASAPTVMSSNLNRSKEAMFRSKGSSRKVSSASSIVEASSSVRPPVIIMDEQEQEAAFRENVGTVSELTFGFEVNEQLLLSDADENSRSASAEPPGAVEEAVVSISPVTGSITSDVPLPEETTTMVPTISISASEDFSARYREPPTQQADNHDLIVAFVGQAWEDVMKEMSASLSQAGGKVQYYSGQ